MKKRRDTRDPSLLDWYSTWKGCTVAGSVCLLEDELCNYFNQSSLYVILSRENERRARRQRERERERNESSRIDFDRPF